MMMPTRTEYREDRRDKAVRQSVPDRPWSNRQTFSELVPHKRLLDLSAASAAQLTYTCTCAYLSSMAKTKRVQILMDPREFDLLERVARKRGSSVSDLMREAARAQYLVDVDCTRNTRAAQNFLSLPDVSLPDWKAVKNELADRHDKIVP